jgi:hypothetical protein
MDLAPPPGRLRNVRPADTAPLPGRGLMDDRFPEQQDEQDLGLPDGEAVDRPPRATRLRIILTMSLLSWLMVALAIAWIARTA